VEGNVALDLLQDLMNVAVQDCDRAEAFEVAERLRAILRAPAPLCVDGPERDMR
jgi:hypothetical protein